MEAERAERQQRQQQYLKELQREEYRQRQERDLEEAAAVIDDYKASHPAHHPSTGARRHTPQRPQIAA
jgi:hypothetical protein